MKIVVSSFSDTVFVNDIKNNIKLVNDFVSDNNMFILATGKNITNVVKLIDNTDFKCSYYICNDGASIFDNFYNVIYRKDIPSNIVKIIYEALSDVDSITDVKIDVSTGLIDDIMRPTNKIVAKYKNKKIALEIAKILNSKFDSIYAYLSTNYINIVSSGVSKGKSLEYLLDYYHLKDNKVYTISKDENDSSLAIYESFVVNDKIFNFKNRVDSFSEALEKIAES